MRLINADALLEALKEKCGDTKYLKPIVDLITNAPTVQREGWVSVSIEPTEEMLESMWQRHKLNDGTDDTYELVVKNNYRLDYKSMIQAAPKE